LDQKFWHIFEYSFIQLYFGRGHLRDAAQITRVGAPSDRA
jgi:hypothetical protein